MVQLWKVITIFSRFGINALEREEVCEGKDGVGREEEVGKANGAVQSSLEIHLGEVFLIASVSFVIQKRGMEVGWFGGSFHLSWCWDYQKLTNVRPFSPNKPVQCSHETMTNCPCHQLVEWWVGFIGWLWSKPWKHDPAAATQRPAERESFVCGERALAADAQDWQMFGLVKWGGVEYLLEDTLFPSPGLAPSEWYRGRSVYYCLIIQINSNWCQLLQPWLVLRKTSCKTLPLSIKFCCPTVQIAGLGKLSFRNKLGDAIVIFKSETKFGGWGHKNIL